MTSVQRVVVGGNGTFVIDALPSANAKGGLSYAWQVRKQYQENYVEKGLVLARQKQNMTVQRYLDMTGISEIL